jgi:hypothetical protein
MPSYKTAFPSKFLKADDLGTTRPIGTIHSVDFEDVGTGHTKDRKLVVRFEEPTLKPLVLNLVNSDTIAGLAGTNNYERWPGCRMLLFATKTEFQGKRVPCIRICAPPNAKPAVSRTPATDDIDESMPTLSDEAEVL